MILDRLDHTVMGNGKRSLLMAVLKNKCKQNIYSLLFLALYDEQQTNQVKSMQLASQHGMFVALASGKKKIIKSKMNSFLV